MIHALDMGVLAFFVLLNAGYVALLLSAALTLVRRRSAAAAGLSESRLLQGRATPAISVVAPAFNEEATIVESVRALLNLRYPEHEVIVVNDGSRDATVQRLKEAFALEAVPVDLRPELPHKPLRAVYRSRADERLLLLDKENGGKADALNAGITAARYGLVCAIDADTLVTPDALLHLAQPFRDDPGALAVGGTIRVANGCHIDRGHVQAAGLPRSLVARFQVVEYLRAFLLGRVGWNRLGGNLIISGAFGLFRRRAVVAAGGYLADTVGEDIELVVRLHRLSHASGAGGGIYHLADPVAFTEVPESLAVLGRQRDRWQRGLADTLWRHRDMMLRPRYGALGLFVLPFFLVFELLGPLVELVGYAYFAVSLLSGSIEPVFALLFLVVALLLGFLLSVSSLLLEELSFSLYRRRGDLARLVLVALLENFGYRQLTLWYRLRGLWGYLRGKKGWGRMVRTGFSGQQPPSPSGRGPG